MFVNNGTACATSTDEYLINANVEQVMFPFSPKDMATCFVKSRQVSKLSNKPVVLGLVDSQNPFKPRDYLSTWENFLLTPLIIKITYTSNNVTNVIAISKYFVYRIDE
jgi:hypothetical protein